MVEVLVNRRVNALNLVVGIILVLIGIGALIPIISPNTPVASLAGEAILALIFIFVGGYETGKYAENNYAKSQKKET